MKRDYVLAFIAIYLFLTPSLSAQVAKQPTQQAGNCSINVSGNGNSASLNCRGIDATLAKQIQTILNGTRQNEAAMKELSAKLDQIIHPPQPDVFLKLVYPAAPALVIVNPSDAVARDMKYAVELWNSSLPDGNDPLQIPTSTFDWLKGHTEGGPMILFTASISSLLKPGDKLYGSANINCPTCVRGRSYLVYIEWGKGGWIAETSDPKGMLLVPAKNTREGRMAYFHQLEQAVAAERIPIGAWPTASDFNPDITTH
jgi:hypothetical protein